MTLQLPAGMTVARFLSGHWQKRPLLIRNAFPGFRGILRPAELTRLARRDDVESRIVSRERGRWQLRHGPFGRSDFERIPREAWTLLVQGVNLHDARVDALLDEFSFLPHARLDDVMVSYAVPRGGVGPHLDSYDVFLLQGLGRRRWRIGRPRDRRLVDGAPLKLLKHYTPEQEWVLEPGDMLYLPPEYAHDGVAIDECTTYSIGFRVPHPGELARALLARLDDTLDERLHQRSYTDPGVKATRHAGAIPDAMLEYAMRTARALSPSDADIEIALGEHLSAPKPHVFFEPPQPLGHPALRRAAKARGVTLDARSRLLYRGRRFFINGEFVPAPAGVIPVLRRLSDARRLIPGELKSEAAASPLWQLLNEWHGNGWLQMPGDGGPDGTKT
jgi:50S ribosomal protein L16 3-hydroxylase